MAGKRVGLIGVGLMGYGIGKNIVTKGNSLKVLAHKNREPVEKLLKLGATEGKTPRENRRRKRRHHPLRHRLAPGRGGGLRQGRAAGRRA